MDILERLRGEAEQAEVMEIRSESTSVRYEANRLKASQVSETTGVAVRAVVDGRIGFAASSDLSAGERVVRNALESAAYGDAIPIAFPGPEQAPEVATYDSEVAELSVERMVAMGQECVAAILAAEPTVQVEAEIRRGVQHVTIRNGAGAQVAVERSPLSLNVQASRVQENDVLMLYDMSGTTLWEEDYLQGVRRLAHKLELAKRDASLRSGRMPVLFAPSGALVLALPLMEGLNGRNVYRGVSPMADKVGRQLFDTQLTLMDDPLLDGRFASASHDDEGVVHRRRTLIDAGVVQGFIYDLRTAAQAGVASTGHGSRSLFSPPGPSFTNLMIQGGTTPLAEMIAGLDEGLLVEDALGLGQGNVISGAFSNSLSLAFKIEHGEIVGRVKDVSIAGNVYDVLRRVAAISQESQWVYYSLKLPYVLIEEMNVVAKA
ncbi:MAG: TldD/PmbA family protein, partial [Anaerolineae bacterium]|nr:TldD/PmbA family protein [Anaerolineae bacterium]